MKALKKRGEGSKALTDLDYEFLSRISLWESLIPFCEEMEAPEPHPPRPKPHRAKPEYDYRVVVARAKEREL